MLPINEKLQEDLKNQVNYLKSRTPIVFLKVILSVNAIIVLLIAALLFYVANLTWSDLYKPEVKFLISSIYISSLFLQVFFVPMITFAYVRESFKSKEEVKLIDLLWFEENYKNKKDNDKKLREYIVDKKYNSYKFLKISEINRVFAPKNIEEIEDIENRIKSLEKSFENYGYKVNMQSFIRQYIF